MSDRCHDHQARCCTRCPETPSLRDRIRAALDDERVTVDALVTKQHADELADQLAEVLSDV